MGEPEARPVFEPIERRSIADKVHDELYRRILTLDLQPGAKVSEVEIARQTGASRQPVRDAFWRLSQIGFLEIRPQRATLVTPISVRSIHNARFLRTALEVETVRTACARFRGEDDAALQRILDQQTAAVTADDRVGFHLLDDELHQAICIRSGVGFAWDLIHVQKAHMDRVRYLSLAFASDQALADHFALADAIRHRKTDRSEAVVREHLGRIDGIIEHIRTEHASFFAEDD